MTCHNCGADNPPTNKFCINCGTEFELRSAPPNPPPLTTYRRSRRDRSNTLLFVAISAVAIICVCLCGGILMWFYIAPNAFSAPVQPAARSSPTRRVTSSPSDTTDDQSRPTTPVAASTPNPSGSTPAAPAATFGKWKVAQVESAFQSAGLEFANPRPMTNDDYGAVPRVAKEAVRFFLPSLGGQKGGRIYAFASASDLQSVKQYYASQTGTPPWIFVKDNILVQIHSDLPENRARQYERALNALK